MATRRWLGTAKAVAEVYTVQITAYDAATTYTITINGNDISVAGDTNANTTAANLSAAWNAASSTVPETSRITATVATDTVTLTADAEGVPFTISTGVTGGTGTISGTNTVQATGPNDWGNADNWSGGAVPVDSDDVIIADTDASILYGLDQSAVTLTSAEIRLTFTGEIGLPDRHPDGYAEYLDTILAVACTTLTIGSGEGSGSGRIRLDLGSAQTATRVIATGTTASGARAALEWQGTHASNTFDVNSGSVGIALGGGESATIATLRIGGDPDAGGGPEVELGDSVTLTTVTKSAGELRTQSSVGTLTQYGGDTITEGSAGATSITVHRGNYHANGSGTISAAIVGTRGTLNMEGDLRSKTISTLDLFAGARFLDRYDVATLSAGCDLNQCDLEEVTIRKGTNKRLTFGSVS